MAYDPGYMQEDELVDVETTLYSVPDRKLLWAGTTESMNPSDIRRTIDQIVDAIAAEPRRTGLIASDTAKCCHLRREARAATAWTGEMEFAKSLISRHAPVAQMDRAQDS